MRAIATRNKSQHTKGEAFDLLSSQRQAANKKMSGEERISEKGAANNPNAGLAREITATKIPLVSR